MKKILSVVFILLLSVFVSGYKLETTLTINDDKSAKYVKTLEASEEEITSKCSIPCEKGDQEYVTIQQTLFANTDVNHKDLINYNVNSSTTNGLLKTFTRNINHIDDLAGTSKSNFDLYSSDYRINMLKLSGMNYVSNIYLNDNDNEIKSGKFILDTSFEVRNSNYTNREGNKYIWDLSSPRRIQFEIVPPTETTVSSDFKSVEITKTITLIGGVAVGLVVLIIFINIIRKSAPKEVQEQIEDNSLNKFAVNDVFNSNANMAKPIEGYEVTQNVMTQEEIKNHEDVISNKFLDDSFAGTTVEEMADEAAREEQINSSASAPIIEENVVKNEPSIPEIEEEKPTETVENSNMSSVAFGGTPIDNKNINEIK